MDSDPIRKHIGSAQESHPEEYNRIMSYLKSEGVEIRFRNGAMAYAPSPSAGPWSINLGSRGINKCSNV